MAWSDDLRAQVLEEFRCAQRVRGGIVERDTKPENVAVARIATSIEAAKEANSRRRRIVRAA